MKQHDSVFLITLFALLNLMVGCNSSSNESTEAITPSFAPIENAYTNSKYSAGDTIEISGSLICAHCYALNENNIGMDHDLPESGHVINCATKCAELGYPVAIYTDKEEDGTRVWVVQFSPSIFPDYMTKRAKVRGTFVRPGLIEPTAMEVNDSIWIKLL